MFENKVKGMDVSTWQDINSTPQMMDMEKAVAGGMKFVFIKASQRLYQDADMLWNADNALEAGLITNFYHFLTPDVSAKAQADFFCDLIEKYPNTLPILDLERTGCGLSATKMFQETVEERLGITPGLYTSIGFWNTLRASTNAIWALKYPLWIANYKKVGLIREIPEDIGVPNLPNLWARKGVDPEFWQICATGDGIYFGAESKGLDVNIYNGTLEELQEKYGNASPGSPPAIKETWVRILDYNHDNRSHLRFRNRAWIYPGHTLAIGHGAELKVTGEKVITDIAWWPVEHDGYRGFVSARPKYTEVFMKG